MKLLLPLLFLVPLALFGQTFSSTVELPIPDDGSTNYYDLEISGLPPTLGTDFGLERVCINLDHAWNGDLFISIVSPDGSETELSSGNGGDSDGFLNTCFDQNASTPIWQGWGPFEGDYKPEGYFTFVNNGQNPNGTWRLKIWDTYAFADTGVLHDWSITFGNNPAQPYPFDASTLPILKINTGGTAILNEQKITAQMQLINHGIGQPHHVDDPPTDYEGQIAIELRGNSSLGMPKRSFNFETQQPDGSNNNASLLGMPAENDWVLLANFSDKSLMRNYLSQEMYRRTGRYSPRMNFCEVVLDGEYQGIYVLGERIKRDSQRLDIATLNSTDNAGEELTGGYILKVDWWNGTNLGGFNSQYMPISEPTSTLFYQYHYPKPDVISQEQMAYIASYVDSFETAMKSPLFQDPELGWRRYGGEQSFIDFILLYEFTNNVDAYWLSTFLHKDKNQKLKPGPPWDFDLAWSNANYSEGWNPQGWRYDWLANNTNLLPFYWQRIHEDTLFEKNFACRWQELRQGAWHTDSLFALIDETQAQLQSPQTVNFDLWPIIGTWVWPNVEPLPQSYDEEVQRLKDWASARFAWMDAQLSGVTCVSAAGEALSAKNISAFPSPFTSEFRVQWPESYLPEGARLTLLNALGEVVFQREDWHGEAIDGSYLTPGCYWLTVQGKDDLWSGWLMKI